MSQSKFKIINMRSITLGTTPASQTLVKELNSLNDPKITYKICKMFNGYTAAFNQLEKLSHSNKIYFGTLMMSEYLEKITDEVEWPGNVRSLFKNVIKTIYDSHTSWKLEHLPKLCHTAGRCDVCGVTEVICRYWQRGENGEMKVKKRFCLSHKQLAFNYDSNHEIVHSKL